MKSLRRKVDEKGLRLSITEGGKEGKSSVIPSCSKLVEQFQECSETEGVGLSTSGEPSGVDLQTTKQLGAKEKSRRKTCDVRRLACQEEWRLPEGQSEDWCGEVAEDGRGPCESVKRTSRWHGVKKRLELRWQMAGAWKKVGVAISLHGVQQVRRLKGGVRPSGFRV